MPSPLGSRVSSSRKHCCRIYADVADPPKHFHVYVVELAGVDGAPTLPPSVYVGQTAHSPQERFQNHLNGIRASRKVRGRGMWLRWRLFDRWNPLPTRDDALAAEKALAEQLHASGDYSVFGVSQLGQAVVDAVAERDGPPFLLDRPAQDVRPSVSLSKHRRRSIPPTEDRPYIVTYSTKHDELLQLPGFPEWQAHLSDQGHKKGFIIGVTRLIGRLPVNHKHRTRDGVLRAEARQIAAELIPRVSADFIRTYGTR